MARNVEHVKAVASSDETSNCNEDNGFIFKLTRFDDEDSDTDSMEATTDQNVLDGNVTDDDTEYRMCKFARLAYIDEVKHAHQLGSPL